MPHIELPTLGKFTSGESRFAIKAACDTCTGCNVGSLGYHLPIAEACPELVKSITYSEEQYSPIVLSGIVSSDGDEPSVSHKTTLNVVIEYHLPFLTKDGHDVSLKIALG